MASNLLNARGSSSWRTFQSERVHRGCCRRASSVQANVQQLLQNTLRQFKHNVKASSHSEHTWTRKVGMPTLDRGKQMAAGALALLLGATLQAGSASAADFVKVGTCLVGNCPVQLAKCIADPTCAQNIACLQNCNGREDESECQIRCGDLYASPAVEEFTKCAVSEKGCVPQRKDGDREYPVPPDRDLVTNFNLNQFKGRWNITAGLNFLFDTFDCQVHDFTQLGPNDLKANINWRISESDGDFIERSAVQTFHQDPEKPGYLRNDKNDFLNYTDDWYIIGFKPDAYAVIYYRGNNDAWEGYGGLTVYTRDLEFPERYKEEIQQSLSKLKVNFDELKKVDNSCPPHPSKTALQKVEGAIEDVNPEEVKPEGKVVDVKD